MKVDLVASRRHYLSHLLPVWQALDPSERGDAYLPPALAAAIPGARARVDPPAKDRPVLVAAYEDLRRLDRVHTPILFEHGLGQSYGGSRESMASPGYAGGDDRDRVAVFCHPNEQAAARDRDRYPDAHVAVVGYPRLAALQKIPGPRPVGEVERPVVAVTFHWHAPLCPETASGFGYWWPAVKALHEAGEVEVLGHGHPRLLPEIERVYHRAGIEVERSFERVLERAHCLVWDNTSAGFEFAATRGPVVVLDNPTYRRDVDHGLRFWDCADVGPRVGELSDLAGAVERALSVGVWPGAEERLARVFPAVEDPAAHAAQVIRRVVGRPQSVSAWV